MRVLIITSEFPPLIGGIGTFTYNIAKALTLAGVSVRVLTSVGQEAPEQLKGVDVLRTANCLNRRGLKLIPLLYQAMRLCVAERPDMIIAMTWTHEGLVASLISRLLHLKYWVIVHGSDILSRRRAGLTRHLMFHCFEHANRILANSQFTKQLFVSLAPQLAFKLSVFNPPIDIEGLDLETDRAAIEAEFNLKQSRVIMTAARLVTRKGHAQMIEILGEIQTEYPDVVYVMTGAGPRSAELQMLAIERGVAHMVRAVGWVSNKKLQMLLRKADIYVSLSQEEEDDVEGFGISLAEAEGLGIPVIAGRCGGVEDAVTDGKTGILVDARDTAAVKQAVLRLLADDGLRKGMGDAGRNLVSDRFGLRSQGEKLRDLLLEFSEAKSFG
jgi:phosphatidylinositol alpha-1,6-mannosyltransferase